MAEAKERSPIIRVDRDTLVPIGLLISIVLTSIGAVWWLSGTIHDLTAQQREAWFQQEKSMLEIRSRIDTLQGQVERLGGQVNDRTADRWRLDDMRTWAELLKAKNPALDIPPVPRAQ